MSKAPSPGYSKAKPPYRGGEYEQPTHEIGGDILIIGGGGATSKDFELIAGNDIEVEDQSNSLVERWKIDYVPTLAVDVELTMVAKEGGVAKANPVLKGTVIDRLELLWTINKNISAQTLINTGGLIAPSLAPEVRDYLYTGQNIQSNINLTLDANDGLGSSDSDVVSLLFGNNLLVGHDINRAGTSVGGLVIAAATMAKTIKTARNHVYFATGGSNQHHYVLYPKSFGLGVFTKGIFTGGYVRLKNVAGSLKTELLGGDVESDIILANEKGFSEAYYAYMSLYDNQNDPVNSFSIT